VIAYLCYPIVCCLVGYHRCRDCGQVFSKKLEDVTKYFYDEEYDIGYYWGSVKVEIIVGEKFAREKDQVGVELPTDSLVRFINETGGMRLD